MFRSPLPANALRAIEDLLGGWQHSDGGCFTTATELIVAEGMLVVSLVWDDNI
jgi:hypothetical protein